MLERLDLPAKMSVRDQEMTLRRVIENDLDDLMRLLADDPISAGRGDTAKAEDRENYLDALQQILDDSRNDLIAVIDSRGELVGSFQLTLIPGLARRGATRLQVEAVKVASNLRSSGIGSAMMNWVIQDAAVQLGAQLVQLTSDVVREDAHRFYTRIGFEASHVGFKYRLDQARN